MLIKCNKTIAVILFLETIELLILACGFNRPINLMIFADEVVISSTYFWGTLSFLVAITSNTPMAEMISPSICQINMFMIALGRIIIFVLYNCFKNLMKKVAHVWIK